MAKSRFEYVKQFEQPDACLANCWIVVRIDGKGFHRFSDAHGFTKPNDDRALILMNEAAEKVMVTYHDVVIGYGVSDEYSFVMKKKTNTYNRRASKLMTTIVSLFTSTYVMNWSKHFPDTPLSYAPSFDGRVVLYPTDQNMKDYLSWRQADCHINNLYNTIFWKLVLEGGMTPKDAEKRLNGTQSGEKNELLFSEFNINYNDLPEMHKKGSVLVKEKKEEEYTHEVPNKDGEGTVMKKLKKNMSVVSLLHVDIIGKSFWEQYPHLIK